MLKNKTLLVTGGTGSLGKTLVDRVLTGEFGLPKKIIVFSRDEAKQYYMRVEYMKKKSSTDDILYENFNQLVEFRIGDVRNYADVTAALNSADIVVNAAALKQVPVCEYFPEQALLTNCTGAANIVRAIHEHGLPVETVIGVSTDKACKPVNVMGMSKALQERIFIAANIHSPNTRFCCVRYGNVLASRGSVIPHFHEQIRNGGPVTITDARMTRFLLSLNQAVDTVMAAMSFGSQGETFIPMVPSANMEILAKALIGKSPVRIEISGIRPGEKLHEILVSEEESYRTYRKQGYYVIQPMLPEITPKANKKRDLISEFSSEHHVLDATGTEELLRKNKLFLEDQPEGALSEAREVIR